MSHFVVGENSNSREAKERLSKSLSFLLHKTLKKTLCGGFPCKVSLSFPEKASCYSTYILGRLFFMASLFLVSKPRFFHMIRIERLLSSEIGSVTVYLWENAGRHATAWSVVPCASAPEYYYPSFSRRGSWSFWRRRSFAPSGSLPSCRAMQTDGCRELSVGEMRLWWRSWSWKVIVFFLPFWKSCSV